jgi:hypothetical protein
MIEKIAELIEEHEAELRADIAEHYEDKLLDAYDEINRLRHLESLLHDLGIDPDGYYSLADRELLRARVAGAAVPGVAAL